MVEYGGLRSVAINGIVLIVSWLVDGICLVALLISRGNIALLLTLLIVTTY